MSEVHAFPELASLFLFFVFVFCFFLFRVKMEDVCELSSLKSGLKVKDGCQ